MEPDRSYHPVLVLLLVVSASLTFLVDNADACGRKDLSRNSWPKLVGEIEVIRESDDPKTQMVKLYVDRDGKVVEPHPIVEDVPTECVLKYEAEEENAGDEKAQDENTKY